MGMVIGTLVFWKAARGQRINARGLSQSLQTGAEPRGLEPLPVGTITAALKKQYPSMEWSDGFAEVDLDDVQAGIELSWKRHHYRFDFYGDGFPQMDVVAALMARFGCACYFVGETDAYPPDKLPKFHDPQADAEFDAKLEAMREHAMAAGPDPKDRLKASLAFMKLTGPPGASATPPAASKKKNKKEPRT